MTDAGKVADTEKERKLHISNVGNTTMSTEFKSVRLEPPLEINSFSNVRDQMKSIEVSGHKFSPRACERARPPSLRNRLILTRSVD